MSTSAEVVWGNTEIKDATKNLKYNAAGVASACVKITNATIYELDIASTGYGSSIDKIPPMCAIITENPVEFTLTLDVAAGSGIPVVAEMNQSVSLTYINSQVPYQIIPLSNLNISSIIYTNSNVTNALDVNKIVEDVNTQSNVTNVKLSTNPLFQGTPTSYTGTFGSTTYLVFVPIPFGGYDEAQFQFQSANGTLGDYTFSLNELRYQTKNHSTFFGISGTLSFNTLSFDNKNDDAVCDIVNLASFNSPLKIFNYIVLAVTSSTSQTDTLTITPLLKFSSTQVVNSSDNPANTLVPSYQFNAVTNGTITTGGTAQTMVGSNSSRRHLVIYNTNTNGNGDILWVQFTDTAGVNKGFPIGPGFNRDFAADDIPTNAISIYGATTGDTYAYEEG